MTPCGIPSKHLVEVDLGGMPFVMNYSGMFMGDMIEFTIDIFGMPFPLTVHRKVE